MKDFKKYYIIPATPEEVYAALTNQYTIQLWTGEEAIMSAEANTEFSLWGGDIAGLNIAFEHNKKIEQEWYFGDQENKSIVTMKLHEHKQGTSLELKHTNIPDEAFDEMCIGWDENYIGSLQDFYADN
jgi:activator of HSP90 ATPase